MRKSELYARYDNFRKEMDEILPEEFYEQLHEATKENYNNYECNGDTSVQEIKTDGYTYMMYSSMWNVGWQGDKDSDHFWCKVKTTTKAEREEMERLFSSGIYG